jgi:hypothetical protein
VTQDQFTQVSKKVFDIPAEDFTINIELFLQTITNVELVRQNWIVSKATSPGREPKFPDLLSDLYHCATLSSLFKSTLKNTNYAAELHLYTLLFICICIIFFDCFGDTKDAADLHLYSFFFTLYSLFVFVFVFV